MNKKTFSLDSDSLKVTSLKHMFKNLFFAGQNNPPHYGEYWEMLFVETNYIMAITPNGTRKVQASHAIFHHPGELHHHYNDSDSDSTIVDICFYASGELINNLSNSIIPFSIKDIENLNGLLNICTLAEASPYPELSSINRQRLQNNVELLLLDLIEKTFSVNVSDAKRNLYENILCILHENIYNNLTIGDIAAMCHQSESYIKKVFLYYSGMGVIKYFNKLKIEEAKYHISCGIPISQISEAMSFSSQNYFSTFFKRETGITPLQFRKNIM